MAFRDSFTFVAVPLETVTFTSAGVAGRETFGERISIPAALVWMLLLVEASGHARGLLDPLPLAVLKQCGFEQPTTPSILAADGGRRPPELKQTATGQG